MTALAVLLFCWCPLLVTSRMFTVANNCPFTIWPALYTDLNVGQAVPSYPTGWQADAFTSVSFAVPDNWKAGRIWARRDCDFTTVNDVTSCISGGCNGGLLCDPKTGTGVPPATLAEWTLQGDGNRDFYDVSLVDGYNIPMRIDNTAGCPVPDCLVDLGPNCPSALQGPFDSTGYALGCKSACEVDPDPQNSPNCCSGAYNTAATCPSVNVQYYSYFKSSCPNAYAYAYDESSGSALWTCDSALAADYILTFCPSTSSSVSVVSSAATGSVTSATGASSTSTSDAIPSSISASTPLGTSAGTVITSNTSTFGSPTTSSSSPSASSTASSTSSGEMTASRGNYTLGLFASILLLSLF